MVDINSELSEGVSSLPLPTFVPLRYQPGSLANWSGHLPFANDLIAQHRPSILVELGTHHGESYFGMCQSVLENGVDCVCYAVDHWLGEEHAGRYGEEVFQEVNDYNQRLYKSFSYLLRSSFDDARDQFSDDSIDILHIDGLHTYEAGFHDFQSWFPKVRPGGIVLLHDVMVRHANFGIWKVWEELQSRHSETFTFHHSWGLGVLRKHGSSTRNSRLLNLLFSADENAREYIRRHYVLYASHIDRLALKERETAQSAVLRPETDQVTQTDQCPFQVYLPEVGGYSELASLTQSLSYETWQTLEFTLPEGVSGSIRLDPADCPCLLEFKAIELHSIEQNSVVWKADTFAALKTLSVQSTAISLPRPDSFHLLSYGSDPQIFLPEVHHPSPLRLVVKARITSNFEPLAAMLTPSVATNSAEINKALVQIFSATEGGYREDVSETAYAEIGTWNTVTFNLPAGALNKPIRFDPADIPCLVELGEFQIVETSTKRLLKSFQGVDELRQFEPLESAMYLPSSDRCLIFCFGDDPSLELKPCLDFQGAVSVRISLKIERRMKSLADLLKASSDHSLSESRLTSDIETLKSELRTSQACRLLLAAELSQFATEKNAILREKEDAISSANNRADQHELLLTSANERIAQLERALGDEAKKTASALQSYNQAMAVVKSVEQSISWKLTKPVRGLMRVIRGGASS